MTLTTRAKVVIIVTVCVLACSGPREADSSTQRFVKFASGAGVFLGIAESDEGASVDAIYMGEWRLHHVHPYLIHVSGPGAIEVRGHRFVWNGNVLALYDSKVPREFREGDFVMVEANGEVRVGPPMH